MIKSGAITSKAMICIDYNGQKHHGITNVMGFSSSLPDLEGLNIKLTPFLIVNVCRAFFFSNKRISYLQNQN